MSPLGRQVQLRQTAMNTKHRTRGFTFVELLVALVVFTLGMLAILRIVPVNRKFIAQSYRRSQAVFLAQERIEQLLSESYTTHNADGLACIGSPSGGCQTTDGYRYAGFLESGVAAATTGQLSDFTITTWIARTSLADETLPVGNATKTATDSDPDANGPVIRYDVTVQWTEFATAQSYTLSTYRNI